MRKMLVGILSLTLLNVLSHIHPGECTSSNIIPAMYIFGDSLNDVGNSPGAKFLPYGRDFPLGPTGRYSNGKVFPDFIADYIGLPYPPPYSSKQRATSPSTIGYNYAYGGCGILPESRGIPFCWTLEEQIGYFRETIAEMESTFDSSEELNQHLADSFYIIWAGNNDYLINYFNNKTVQYNPDDFAQLLVHTLFDNLQMLYNLGARKGLVMEVGVLGCTPESRGDHDESWCDESKNQNAKIFNKKLGSIMQTLPSTLPHSHFSLGKFYDPSVDAIHHPAKKGFTNVGKPCCQISKFGTSCLPCLSVAERKGMVCLPLAGNPDEFIFWDGAHPTEASVSRLANDCIHGSSLCVPFNVEQLLQLKPEPASFLKLLPTT